MLNATQLLRTEPAQSAPEVRGVKTSHHQFPGIVSKVVRLSPGRTLPSSFWEERLRQSLANPPRVPWHEATNISPAEVEAIRASIQEFQLGEQSEGRHLSKAAREHARESGDPAYFRAMQLFIREEQHHAALLGRFMDAVGIARASRTFADSVFRKLRRLTGLEVSICVLLTAEIIARVYYRALLLATRSPALRAICHRILDDEAGHVRFQSERLAILRRKRPRFALLASMLLQGLLYAGSLLVVWRGHRAALRAGGFSFGEFWKSCWREFRAALAWMDPAGYEW